MKDIEFINRMLKRKNNQSFDILGLKVIFLKYAVNPHIKK